MGSIDFGYALENLIVGRKMARWGWNGKGMFIKLKRPHHDAFITKPYIFISDVKGEVVPWVPSQDDILGTDWLVVPE